MIKNTAISFWNCGVALCDGKVFGLRAICSKKRDWLARFVALALNLMAKMLSCIW
jgi:hypothetical protein